MGNSLGNGDWTQTTTFPTDNPSRLLDEWASWERNHGDANQVHPTVDKVIHITYPPGAGGNGADGVGDGKSSNDPCGAYLIASSTGLRGGPPPEKPDPAKLEMFSQSTQTNGMPDFPDPSSDRLTLRSQAGSRLSLENSTFKNASELSTKTIGVPFSGNGTPQSWYIESLSTGQPGSGPGGNRGAGAGTKPNSVSGSG
jgi:hypothetical protein